MLSPTGSCFCPEGPRDLLLGQQNGAICGPSGQKQLQREYPKRSGCDVHWRPMENQRANLESCCYKGFQLVHSSMSGQGCN